MVLIIVLPRNSFRAISMAIGVPQRMAKMTAVPEKKEGTVDDSVEFWVACNYQFERF